MWTATLRMMRAALAPELRLDDAAAVLALTAQVGDFLTRPDGDAQELAVRAAALTPALDGLGAIAARFASTGAHAGAAAGGRASAGAPDAADFVTAACWADLADALARDASTLVQPSLAAVAAALAPARAALGRFDFAAGLAWLARAWAPGDDRLDAAANAYVAACAALDRFGGEALHRKVASTLQPGRPFLVVYFAAAVLKTPAARADVAAELDDLALECVSMLDNFYWIDRPDE